MIYPKSQNDARRYGSSTKKNVRERIKPTAEVLYMQNLGVHLTFNRGYYRQHFFCSSPVTNFHSSSRRECSKLLAVLSMSRLHRVRRRDIGSVLGSFFSHEFVVVVLSVLDPEHDCLDSQYDGRCCPDPDKIWVLDSRRQNLTQR